ncbi:MAG: type III polyketide synthase [Cyclobacteriaceae bacterium]|nr:type III polyketide synthase [Cyclobacteriaceae bacterium]
MGYITSIGTSNPLHKFRQSQIADFMIKAMQLNREEAQQLKVLYRATGIETRYTVLEDYGNPELYKFFPNSKNFEPFPSTKSRMELYQHQAINISKDAVFNCLKGLHDFNNKEITHLIVVSCTGMFAPGLDLALVNELRLNATIQRTSINFMGCYAAFNAIRVADSFCSQSSNAKVLIVCTELCSIHFQKENTEDNKLANAIFADGSAALLLESLPRKSKSLKVGKSFCDIALSGIDEMAWSIGDFGFEMKLSTYVPEVIRHGIKILTASLLVANQIKMTDIDYYAIHPGGKKILEAVESELSLKKSDNRFSYSVMKKHGNMSSPTVLFVLQEIYQQLSPQDHNKKILSFGFGPGLTFESLILSIEYN